MIDQLFSSFPWQVIVFASGLMTGFSHFMRKSQLDRLGVFQAGFWKDLSSLILGVFLVISSGATFHPMGWWVVGAGFLAGVGNGAYMSALRGDMSGTSAFGTSAGQLFILLGSFLFLGEWKYFEPTNLQGLVNLVSVVIFFAGMWLYSEAKVGKWWKMMLVAISTNVAVNLLSKYVLGYGVGAAENTALLYLGTLVGDSVILLMRKQSIMIGKTDIYLGLFQGLLGGLSVYLYVKALEIAPLSLVSITRRVAVMAFTIFIGMMWFGERKTITWRKVVGLTMALAVFGLVAVVNK